MKERPILFGGEMVRAILAGRKTRTRRVMNPQPPSGNYRYDGVGDVEKDLDDWDPECHWLEVLDDDGEYAERYWKAGKCPFGVPGDRLWVRETWAEFNEVDQFDDLCGGYYYRATEEDDDGIKWRPSIHMPRCASRIILEITGVRAERLWDISENDARSEGFESVMEFDRFWNSIAKPGEKWEDIPWVWVVEFRRVDNEKL